MYSICVCCSVKPVQRVWWGNLGFMIESVVNIELPGIFGAACWVWKPVTITVSHLCLFSAANISWSNQQTFSKCRFIHRVKVLFWTTSLSTATQKEKKINLKSSGKWSQGHRTNQRVWRSKRAWITCSQRCITIAKKQRGKTHTHTHTISLSYL